jgi:succinyl-diaminopimelate desuccinylase
MSEALDLCRALIRCPSVTPADAGALGLIERVLGEAGFETRPVASDAMASVSAAFEDGW